MSDGQTKPGREGSLEAPTRHALGWQDPQFYDAAALDKELERVFDICHGCRRCFNLCNSFPTLFDLIDESKTGELDGVDKKAFGQVVDQCYLCDMCYMTKCPYVPPHPWNVDFPHLMLRAKAVKNRERRHTLARQGSELRPTRSASSREYPWSPRWSTQSIAAPLGRKLLDAALGVHPDAPVPPYRSNTLRKQLAKRPKPDGAAQAAGGTRGKVALFATCYTNRNEPEHRARSGAGIRAQRHRSRPGGVGALLRHAEAGTRRSAGGGGLESQERAAAARHDRARLRHRRAHPFLRVDVQAGAAADVPGR